MNMHNDAAATDSVWFANLAGLKSGRALSGNDSVDVCIVGAGIAGVSCAYQLARAGKRVAVIDLGAVGGGQTAMTTAHLSNHVDHTYKTIEGIHGADNARLVAESHTAAIAEIARIAAAEQIECEFQSVVGYLLPSDDPHELDRELAACHRAGLADVVRLEQWPVFSPGSTRGAPCLKFPGQAQFHPLKYLRGLADACEKKYGVVFYEGRVVEVKGGPAAFVETAEKHRIQADSIIVATNSPVNDQYVMHTKQAPYTTYVVGLEVQAGTIPQALYWDLDDPFHYVRLAPGEDERGGPEVLIVGGEDHKTGQAGDGAERFARLEAWARERFPSLGPRRFQWCGQVMEPIDHVAFIGRNPLDERNVYIVTGDSGLGMTHGTMSGLILADLILDRPNPWAKLYDPSRKTLAALWEFVKENANVAMQYADWLQPSKVESSAEIAPGSGAVIRNGSQLIAAYRDESGALHECSAACPHLGGVVAWNDTASTWDCPCHGSRFDPHGHVIQGPAASDLTPITPPVAK